MNDNYFFNVAMLHGHAGSSSHHCVTNARSCLHGTNTH
jgi:hypothetical protein